MSSSAALLEKAAYFELAGLVADIRRLDSQIVELACQGADCDRKLLSAVLKERERCKAQLLAVCELTRVLGHGAQEILQSVASETV